MKMIFTLTAGRTGTSYLASLLGDNIPRARTYHEWIGFNTFGIHTPAVRHFSLFNTEGNIEEVRKFWNTKYETILREPTGCYIETSHVLMKAGLVENMVELAKDHELHFIILTRNVHDMVVSYVNRYDFLNLPSLLLWGLDPNYPRNILKLDKKNQVFPDQYLWYAYEILVRSYYYRIKYQGLPNVYFHEYDLYNIQTPEAVQNLLEALGEKRALNAITIPEKKNESTLQLVAKTNEYITHLVARSCYDIRAMAEQFFNRPLCGW